MAVLYQKKTTVAFVISFLEMQIDQFSKIRSHYGDIKIYVD